MKNIRPLIKLFLLNIVFLFSTMTINACELPYFKISDCFKSQTWATWSSDYNIVKDVCAGMPIDISVYCSKGELSYGDEVCIYEIVGGIETLLFCEDASTFSFIPEEGKTYRIETLSGGSPSYTVSFTAVDCLDLEVFQNNDCDNLYENEPISFSIPEFNSDCYLVDWDFGDGNQIEYGSNQVSYAYDIDFSDPCQTCKTFVVTITLNNELCGEDCPELTFEKEVTVCRETEFFTGYADEYVEQCYDNPCLELGDYSNVVINIPPCYYDGYSFEWTIIDFYGNVQESIPQLQTSVCPAVEGTYTLTMTDPWGCTFSKTLFVYYSSQPDTTIIEHILCTENQEMLLYSPGDCQNIEYDPPYIMLPPYSNPHFIRCYDDNGCLNKVYVHQPIYQIEQACIDDLDDICEGDELIVDGSCSGTHYKHKWQIFEFGAGSETLLWSKTYKKKWFWQPNIAGVKNLSEESDISFLVGKCYKVKLSIAYICEGQVHWNTTEKEFCVNPKPPCFGGPDIILDPCATDCVTIGLNGYSDVIPYPYPNLTHEWEDGTSGVYRTVCPTETTTYYLTTTNEYGCVCIDEVTVTVVEHEPISNSDFPVCFSNNNPNGLGQECELEVCLDVQINTGSSCECAYSVIQLCQIIPFGESFCFDQELLDFPIGEIFCTSVIGSKFTLGGNMAYVNGFNFTDHAYFNGSNCPCHKYTHLLFETLSDGTILLIPTYTVGMINGDQNDQKSLADLDVNFSNQRNKTVARSDHEHQSDILIFPNPVHSLLNIESNENIYSIKLYSINGELAYTKELGKDSSNSHSLDTTTLQSGMYIIKITTSNKIESRSIVISH